MRIHKNMTIMACLGIAMLLLAGCGSSSSSTPPVVSSGNTYLVEYIPGTSPAAEGKTTFQLRIRKSADGSLATGLTPTLVPTMHMTSGMMHGTPVDVVTETIPGTSGVYNCTIYYLMADHMGMKPVGYWELEVQVGSETATFYPTVDMAMGADTVYATMQSVDDMKNSKKYYLFSDGMVSAASPTFLLYISRAENNPPTIFTPISSATTTSLIVTAATDTGFTTAVSATDDGNGHFSMPMSALSTTDSYTVYIKLNVNGEDKLASGLTYTAFKVTPH